MNYQCILKNIFITIVRRFIEPDLNIIKTKILDVDLYEKR